MIINVVQSTVIVFGVYEINFGDTFIKLQNIALALFYEKLTSDSFISYLYPIRST